MVCVYHLTAIIDANGQQGMGSTRDILRIENLDERFRTAGWDAEVAGNIGPAVLDMVMQRQDSGKLPQAWILEISSFQLETIETFRPYVAVVLNVTPDHLDRHGTMEAYTAAKARLLDFQSQGDVAILGRDDPGAWSLAEKVPGRLFSFGFGHLPEGVTLTARNPLFALTTFSVALRRDTLALAIAPLCAFAAARSSPPVIASVFAVFPVL